MMWTILLLLCCISLCSSLKAKHDISKSVNRFSHKSISVDRTLDVKSYNQSNQNHAKRLGALALTALVVQNSALTICMRMTRKGVSGSTAQLYIPTTAVVISETLKLLVSIMYYVLSDCKRDVRKATTLFSQEIKDNWKEIIKVTIPAGLYVIQNNLQFVAVSNLPAEVYQVLIQSKIVTTAFFSVWVLNRRPSIIQWLSVFFLTVGVAIVQLSFPTRAVATQAVNYFVGFIAILVSCFTSGFAGVYFEKIMKSKPNILWLRNIEMSLISVLIAIIAAGGKDLTLIRQYGFFHGYNPMVFGVIMLQAFGGILVSLVVKYTNSMTKGFATSGSIILSCILSAYILKDSTLNTVFFLGALVVCLATVAYSLPATFYQSSNPIYQKIRSLFISSSSSPSPPAVVASSRMLSNNSPTTIMSQYLNEEDDLENEYNQRLLLNTHHTYKQHQQQQHHQQHNTHHILPSIPSESITTNTPTSVISTTTTSSSSSSSSNNVHMNNNRDIN